MRLFLFPITRSRTLLYAKQFETTASPPVRNPPLSPSSSTSSPTSSAPPPNPSSSSSPSLLDRLSHRASNLWARWEQHDRGWQKHVVTYGNAALRRIAFEEWALKSVPPLARAQRRGWEAILRRHAEALQTQGAATGSSSTKSGVKGPPAAMEPPRVEVVFPASQIPPSSVQPLLRKLVTERESLHRRRLVWCLIGMPISAPFALVPLIPNLPFFYLAYRAFSHWRAIAGGRHVQFLLHNDLVSYTPSHILDDIYIAHATKVLPPSLSTHATGKGNDGASGADADAVLLSQDQIRRIAGALDMPEVASELERAIWQIGGLSSSKR